MHGRKANAKVYVVSTQKNSLSAWGGSLVEHLKLNV